MDIKYIISLMIDILIWIYVVGIYIELRRKP